MSQAQLCLTLYSPMDCSLPGSSVHGIFLLEWVATPTPGDLPNPGMNLRTMCLVRWQPDLYHCSTCEATKEGHYFTVKGSILQKDVTIINMYVPNNRASKYMRQKLTE